MPFRTGSTPFTGDDDMADFLVDVMQPFLTDAFGSGGLAWTSQDPDGGAGGGGSHPNYQRMFSRGGVGTEAPPFVMYQTTAKTLYIFTGDDVNITQEPYDQPNNPMNGPPDASFSDPVTRMCNLQCLALPTVVGPYDSYWLFGGLSAEYMHVVLKVNSRQYRHFHVGMFTPLHSDFDADSFYVTNHRWAFLGPDNLSGDNGANSNNKEHQPYGDQFLPFRNNGDVNISVGDDCRSCGMMIYSPAFGSEGLDWWIPVGKRRSTTGSNGGADETIGRVRNAAGLGTVGAIALTKNTGDVNETSDAVAIGAAYVGGYDTSLGALPFAMEPTFTTDGVALMPIYICLPTDFESELRWGPVAVVPDVYRVNMKSLDAEEEIIIGSDTYIVFPMINKDSANTLDNEGYSGFEGLAYKKITADAS